MSGSRHTVVVLSELADDDPEADLDLHRWERLAAAALEVERAPTGELNLLFVDEYVMTQLNIEHMEGEGPTDVLAFPIDADDALEGGLPVLLGDIVICPAVARRYAAEHGVALVDELALLVVHGVLHILGHDHAEPEETAYMKEREQALLAAHHGP